MGKFEGILICTDLDGTLLNSNRVISKENLEAIEYFKKEGGFFSFVTGRLPYYAMHIYNTIKPNAPFGVVNGGGLFDGENNKYIWTKPLSKSVFELVKCIDEKFANIGIMANCFERTFFLKENESTDNFRKATKVPKLLVNFNEIEDSIAKITFCSENDEEILAVEKALKEQISSNDFDFILAEKTLFEILPKGVSKGVAVKKLAEYLSVDINKTIAIGDYNNDVSMIKTAKIGVAVKNACKEALNAANYITVSNDENAIAQIISDLENGIINL